MISAAVHAEGDEGTELLLSVMSTLGIRGLRLGVDIYGSSN
jgi:hypothetical protein